MSYQREGLGLLLLLLGACVPRSGPPSPLPSEPPPDLHPGVQSQELSALLEEHWQATLSQQPIWATDLGLDQYDALLPDSSKAAQERWRAQRTEWLERAQALTEEVAEEDRVTLQIFLASLENERATEVCALETWSLLPRSSFLQFIAYIPEVHTLESPQRGEALLQRYRSLPIYLEGRMESLRRGLAEGRVANAESTRLIIEMVDAQLARSNETWELGEPVCPTGDGCWSPEEEEAFRQGLADATAAVIRPTLVRYRDLLRDEILPAARGPEAAGLGGISGAEGCYEALIQRYTTLTMSADEIHQRGLTELERIHREMGVIGERLYGEADTAGIFAHLRTDPALYFGSEQEVEDAANKALARAKDAMSGAFDPQPQADCIVTRVPEFEAPYTSIAYYRPGSPGGERPGQYYINTYAPETRPRYEAEVLAYHEAIPGHHLQISLAQELPEMPEFRRHLDMTVFVEGWALYSEQLADEMGLYTGDLDRLGMLGFESWRAARLVVDTGLHARGWTREQAVTFLLENTPLAENNIRNEVDRYITWPGQALAYKTGQIEIWRLRREAEAALGSAFDLRSFHRVLLGSGPVTMPVLDAQVQAWVEDNKPL